MTNLSMISENDNSTVLTEYKGLNKTETFYQSEDALEKELIKTLKQDVLMLKELEQHQAVRVTDLYLGYHKPKGEYETSYGWMFLMRSNHFTFTNVIDMQVYRASDFETIIYYPEYMEKHEIENIYPIYDAKMCYEKIKTL